MSGVVRLTQGLTAHHERKKGKGTAYAVSSLG